MSLSSDYLACRARRYRHLARKAQALLDLAPDDPTAPRLRELADKLLLDAAQDEREAGELRADEAETAREN